MSEHTRRPGLALFVGRKLVVAELESSNFREFAFLRQLTAKTKNNLADISLPPTPLPPAPQIQKEARHDREINTEPFTVSVSESK